MLAVLGWLAACDSTLDEAKFEDGPKGYVEFFIPSPDPGPNSSEDAIDIDTQIYRLVNGQRVFLGMTRKWDGLAEGKRGLTVTVPPGRHDFVISYGGADARTQVDVRDGDYQRVRITFSEMSRQQLIGATQQLRFSIQASVEPQQ